MKLLRLLGTALSQAARWWYTFVTSRKTNAGTAVAMLGSLFVMCCGLSVILAPFTGSSSRASQANATQATAVAVVPTKAAPTSPTSPNNSQTVAVNTQEVTTETHSRVSAEVVRVIDGDTVDVSIDGKTERIRLIGIDTPETVHPSRPVECFGKEASQKAKEFLDNQSVTLEADATQDNQDSFGRLLRYIWLPDGKMVNQEMVSQGYAFEYTYRVPYKYQAEFKQAQIDAREEQRGLWAASTCNGESKPAAEAQPTLVPTATPEPTQEPTAAPVPTEPAPPPTEKPAPPPAANCDPSYPGVCIPPKSQVGDLDCKDVPYARFQVLPPDPHGFDGRDNDGLGCESN